MRKIFMIFLLTGCAVQTWNAPPDFAYREIDVGGYKIATWLRDSGTGPIHIYIEGDGNAFNGHGRPTYDPTPRGILVRDMAARDTAQNVVYLARPCQYVMTDKCTSVDWTHGRFSPDIVNAMGDVVAHFGAGRPVTLIGYSGGALLSGLIVSGRPDITVQKWITIAGVLNHVDWTEYFGDIPLHDSLNLEELPRVSQIHYIAPNDSVVPNALSYKWLAGHDVVVVQNATHNNFHNLVIE